MLRLLKEMAKRFPIAQMYLNMEFGFENQVIVEKYKKALIKEYFPTRGHGKARSSKVNQMLKEFTQIAAFQEDVLEIYFFQVELAVQYYRAYLYEYMPFLNQIYKNWTFIIKLAHQGGWADTYQPRVDKMLDENFIRYDLGESMIFMWNEGPELENDPEDLDA